MFLAPVLLAGCSLTEQVLDMNFLQWLGEEKSQTQTKIYIF